jgi:hypothetical protein
MVDAIARVDEIDPAACRRSVEERFDVPRMADRYLELYGRIIGAETSASVPLSILETRPGQAEQVALG